MCKKNISICCIVVLLTIVPFLSIQEESQRLISNAFADNIHSIDGNFRNKSALDTEHLSANILSIREMASLVGGCSGGTCNEYYHVCPPECDHLYSQQCGGTSGSCVNSGRSPVCRCDGNYDYIQSCD